MWESNSEASLEKEASKLSYKRKGLSASLYQSLSRLPTERTWSTMSTKPLIWLPKSRILSKFHHSWNLPKSRILSKFHHSWNLPKFRILSLFQHLWSLSNSEIISIYCIISTLWIHRKYSEISFITHLYSFELISTTHGVTNYSRTIGKPPLKAKIINLSTPINIYTVEAKYILNSGMSNISTSKNS